LHSRLSQILHTRPILGYLIGVEDPDLADALSLLSRAAFMKTVRFVLALLALARLSCTLLAG
jgi:hypothetical protein